MQPPKPTLARRPARVRRPVPDRFVHLLTSTLWTSGPLGQLPAPARALWLRLATGPEMTAIPGLAVVRAEEIGQSLGWSPEEVERVASTIPATSLRADWRAGVVWIPQLVRWQAPRSPKNVLGWRMPWADLPATALADEILEELRIACGPRGAAFLRAFEELRPQAPAAPTPAPSIDIRGTTVTMSGLAEGIDRAALAREVVRQLCGVEITLPAPVALAEPIAPARPAPLALPSMHAYVPSAPAPRGRRSKAQVVLDERADDLDKILRYQAARRGAAFELIGKAPTPIDEAACRKAIAERLAEGHSVAACETVCDRLYERVGSESSLSARASQAGWWTHMAWAARSFSTLLGLDVGSSAPTGVAGLAKAINGIAPRGATSISHLSAKEVRPLAELLQLGRQDDQDILAAATTFALVIAEQETQLARRVLDRERGEVQLAKLWGSTMFRTGPWTAILTAVERFELGSRAPDLFLEVSVALTAAENAARGSRAG